MEKLTHVATVHTTLWSNIVRFFDSSFFLSVTTLIIGFVALVVYYKQKIDHRKDAARIILLEIKNAERKLAQARDLILIDDRLPETSFTMKTASWNKYSHLFANDFSDTDWDSINTFYEKCATYDEIIENGRLYSGKNEEQARINIHKAVAGYTKVYVQEVQKNATKVESERTRLNKEAYDVYYDSLHSFADSYLDDEFVKAYKSTKPHTDANNLILTMVQD